MQRHSILLRGGYLVGGILVCIAGIGIVFYQISESCEDSAIANAYAGYPWCTDILDHINLTFVGIMALIVGVVILSFGGPLHWILEPSVEPEAQVVQGDNPRREAP
jgi:hypothetical protein